MDEFRPHLKVPGEIERGRASGPVGPLLRDDEIERRASCATAGRQRDHGSNAWATHSRTATAVLRGVRGRKVEGATEDAVGGGRGGLLG